MSDGAQVAALRAGRLIDGLALALVDMEPLFNWSDKQDLRELVIHLGWWSGRLAATAEAHEESGTRGTAP